MSLKKCQKKISKRGRFSRANSLIIKDLTKWKTLKSSPQKVKMLIIKHLVLKNVAQWVKIEQKE